MKHNFDERDNMIKAMNKYKRPTSTISSDELNEMLSTRHHVAVRDIAALMMIDAAVGEQLSRANDAADVEDYETQAQLIDSLRVKISFGDYTASVSLGCMDTYAFFCEFIAEAIYNLDVFRD